MNAVSHYNATGSVTREWLAECRAMEDEARAAQIANQVEALNTRVTRIRLSDHLLTLVNVYRNQIAVRDDSGCARTLAKIAQTVVEMERA